MTSAAPPREIEQYRVDAVDAALGLLMLIAETPDLGLSEITRRSGQSKARVYRLLCSLEANGFVSCSTEKRSYRLGLAAVAVGNAAERQIDIARVAAPIVARLGSDTGETVQLRVRDGRNSLCVAGWEPDRAVKVLANIGGSRPMHAGSGVVLLAFQDEAFRESVLGEPLKAFTERTCVDPERLRQILAAVREQGYYVSHGEVSPDLISISAPVMGRDGKIIATIHIGAPTGRVSDSLLPNHIETVRRAARELSALLGGARTAV
ncbi:IclR family transcriptional regulator [Bosea sp. UNC402CLCol]|uniref:IclR family transcriptional regulator n=1 Tax=Bosea sp. UNC402CLCol TaxID=1510531 RepID=UPI000689F397|nr:IclR family transcriptional regulator [Bosea sp. UNC402CLCol]